MSMIPINHWRDGDAYAGHVTYESVRPSPRRLYAVRRHSALHQLSSATTACIVAKLQTKELREKGFLWNEPALTAMMAERRENAKRAAACAARALFAIQLGFYV